MEQINNDMDELFRRAANDYPLNTDSADWNAVIKKLQADEPVNISSKNKNYRRLLWLLLLLIPVLIYKNYFSENNETGDTISKNISNKSFPDVSLSKKTYPSISSLQKVDVTSNKPSLTLKNSSVIQRKVKGKFNSIIGENTSLTVIPINSSSNNSIPADMPERSENRAVSEVNKDNNENKKEIVIKPGDKKTDSVFSNKEETAKDSGKKIRKRKESGLYAGIIISPDISTVKFQSVKKVGISMGVIAGYQINKKISVESGVSWSIKNYYTDGKYFSTNNIRMPSGAKIKNVDGVCNMIEVPLTIKYNFKASGKQIISASTGVSSYFMKKEKYDYEIDRNGQLYPYSSTYKKKSSDLFAVANLALGYNRQIKNNFTLRIEPYIKIPLTGVGIGSLPIMSTGLHIGIIKKLSR